MHNAILVFYFLRSVETCAAGLLEFMADVHGWNALPDNHGPTDASHVM